MIEEESLLNTYQKITVVSLWQSLKLTGYPRIKKKKKKKFTYYLYLCNYVFINTLPKINYKKIIFLNYVLLTLYGILVGFENVSTYNNMWVNFLNE